MNIKVTQKHTAPAYDAASVAHIYFNEELKEFIVAYQQQGLEQRSEILSKDKEIWITTSGSD